MPRWGRLICATAFAVAALLLGLRLWIAHRIEISLRQPVICITARDRATMAAGRFPTRSRDLLVVRNAQFGNGAPSGPTPGWHMKGLLISLGYDLLWSKRGRAAEFERMEPHLRDCPQSSQMRR